MPPAAGNWRLNTKVASQATNVWTFALNERRPPSGDPLIARRKRPTLGQAPAENRLLQLDGAAGVLDLALQLLGLVAVEALLDRLGGLVNEPRGLLEDQGGC